MDEQTRETAEAQRGRYDNIFGGAASAAPIVPRAASSERKGALARAGGGFLRWALTATITLGAMYVLGFAGSVAAVTAFSRRFYRPTTFPTVIERRAVTVPALAYRLAPDPSITPEAAGRALHALSPAPTTNPTPFVFLDVERPVAPWRVLPLPTDVFPGGRTSGGGFPNVDSVLVVAARGATPAQREVLRVIGTAPVWTEYDRVARARAVDIVGGRFKLPFSDSAHFWAMPALRNAGSADLAYAGVSRAAWHLSEGRRAAAEDALRAIISVGAGMAENSSTVFDELVGYRVINIGRIALVRYYNLVGDRRGAALAAAVEAAQKGYVPPDVVKPIAPGTTAEVRARLLAVINAPDLPRGVRIETLSQLRFAGCSSAREVVFGGNDEVRRATDALTAAIAKHPGDRAVIELLGRGLDDPGLDYIFRGGGGAEEAVRLVGKIYFNPRLSACFFGAIGGGRF